ncbi:MAG: hypothetical protein QNL70_07745 [Pseudomonas sp.]
MYESKTQPLTTSKAFRMRMYLHVLLALLLILVMLLAGTVGHVYFDDMEPSRALVASLTLSSGLGLSILPSSLSGQLFASIYGVFSNYVFIATCTIVLAPLVHRVFHKFHLDED